jgi:hypothetical protein
MKTRSRFRRASANPISQRSEVFACGSIAAELQRMGYTASAGAVQKPPGRVDAVVSYMDRWMWDITMYMISLDIQIREPGTEAILANAKTARSSLVRKSQEEMVRETLNKLLHNR